MRRRAFAEGWMLPYLLTAALALGQVGPSPEPRTAENSSNNGDDGDAKEDSRYFLMKALEPTRFGAALDAHKIQISGWTHLSFTASSAAHEQLPMGFNYRANEFLVQQNWLRIERPVDTDSKTASFGFRSDTILPGSDYRFTIARGLFDGQLRGNGGNPVLEGIDPIQFYGEAYFPNVCQGLTVKAGRIFCQYGVEANDAPSNALLSHAYTFIYNPFTHTGIMGTLKLSDTWSVQSGIMMGNDVFIDPASEPYYMGSIKWAPKDGKDTALFSVILGSGRFNQAEQFHNPQIFDFIYTHKFNSKLNYSFEALYGYTTNVPDVGFANWLGILNYLTYDFTDKVSGTTRLEFFDDFQAQRTGFHGLYTAITAGISWKPCRSIIMRPEFRYDYNGDSRPFADRHGLFTASTDMIIRW
jgi:Putative beta-barrel porin-2, OmpL-like. bbp2